MNKRSVEAPASHHMFMIIGHTCKDADFCAQSHFYTFFIMTIKNKGPQHYKQHLQA